MFIWRHGILQKTGNFNEFAGQVASHAVIFIISCLSFISSSPKFYGQVRFAATCKSQWREPGVSGTGPLLTKARANEMI